MKTFDEYIRSRIFNLFIQVMPKGFEGGFYDLANERDEKTVAQWQATLIYLGVGKQRARDYAHYIEAWLEEQNEPLYTSAVAYANESAIEKSHLTDEDAEKIIRQLTVFDMTKCTVIQELGSVTYMVDNTELINFINSLKGDNNG